MCFEEFDGVLLFNFDGWAVSLTPPWNMCVLKVTSCHINES